MKDYSITEEDKKNFILRLKFTDTSIIACMADGREEEYPYNREELISLLKRMEQQVKNSDNYLNILNQKHYRLKEIFKLCGILSLLVAIMFAILHNSYYFRLLGYIEWGIIATTGMGMIPSFIKNKKKINDVLKNRLYVENIDLLNDIDLSKVRKKAREKIGDSIDINKVDKMSKREIESLVNNGRFNRNFHAKFKKLVRTKNNNK